MPDPADSEMVLTALRFGWCLAEVRGRSRPGGPQPPADVLPDREGHVLPLRVERTAPELRIEAQVVLQKLAGDLAVDMAVAGDQKTLVALIDQQARALAAAVPQAPAAAQSWEALAD